MEEWNRAVSQPSNLPAFQSSRFWVHGDEGKLRQLLNNLLSNAVKFTEKGEVILRISTSTPSEDGSMEGRSLDSRKAEEEIEESTDHPSLSSVSRFMFEVIDTGVGISESDQAKILEPFQQGEVGTATEGTGLGLTIAQQLIEAKFQPRSVASTLMAPPRLVAVSASALHHERQKYFDAGFDDFIAKPFLATRIYDCLARLLRVEYEYGGAATQPVDFSKTVLPEELHEKLKKDASLYRTTDVERHIDSMQELGKDAELLAEHLRALNQNGDMGAILTLLDQVQFQ